MTSTTPTTPTTVSRIEPGRLTRRIALRRAALAALVSIGAIASTGCDNADSRAAREAIQQAAIARNVADPEKASKSVEAKVGSLAPTDAVQLAHARSMLAGAKLAAVRAQLPELRAAEAEVIASLGVVDASVAIAGGAASDANALALRDPASTIAQVQTVAANTRGDGNAPFAFSQELVDASGKSVKVEVPSQSAIALRISELNGAITRTEDQIKKMNDELAAHNVAAGEAALAAESGKTAEERLAKLDEAKNHRIEAAARSQEIGNAEAALGQLKAQLVAAENQKASLDDAAQALEARIATLKASSTAVTAAVADRRKAAAALLSADSLDPVDKVTERKPSEVLAKADELRKSILDEYAAVLKAYDEAAAAGATVAKDLSGYNDSSIPESAVWAITVETVSAPRYKLAAASAKLDVAGVHYAHALLLAKQNEIAQSLGELFGKGGLTGTAPQTLDAAETSKALAAAIEAANAAYNDASALVDGASGTPASKATKSGATVVKPYVLYGQSQVAALAERVGVKITVSEGSDSKAQTAKELLAAAKAAAKEAFEQNLPVGHLPSEFADVIPKKEAEPAAEVGTASKAGEGTESGAGSSAANDDVALVKAVRSKQFEALAAGDFDRFRALNSVEPGAEERFASAMTYHTELFRLIRTTEKINTQISATLLNGFKNRFVRAGSVVVTGDTASETFPPGSGNIDRTYKRVDGEWRTLVPAAEDANAVEAVSKVTPLMKAISDDIDSGSISTREQLEQRFEELLQAMKPVLETTPDASGSTPPASDAPPAGEAAPAGEAPPAAPATPPSGDTPPAAP